MKPAKAKSAGGTDIASTIISAMRELQISPIPRNYELIYEAYVGTNHALGAELLALGNRPTQDQLDTLSERHLLAASGVAAVERARDNVAREAEDIMTLLSREKLSLEKYGRILDKTQDGLRSTQALSQDILQKIVGIITNATASTIDQGHQTFASMLDKSAELEKVKSSLEEYKRLADTDGLTQLFNRRAFDTALARLFASSSHSGSASLILADIDRFKDVNDRFGHPVGDQILQIVAGIMRAHGGQRAMISRTGGEEFALLLDKETPASATEFAEQIRRSIEETPFVNKANSASYGPITISIGVCMGAQANGAADLYSKADRALYMSKMKGRNCVSVYGEQAEVRENPQGKNWLLYSKE